MKGPFQITRKPDPWPCLRTGKPMYEFTLASADRVVQVVSSRSAVVPAVLLRKQAVLNTKALLDSGNNPFIP